MIPEDRTPSDTAAAKPPQCAPLPASDPATAGSTVGSRCSTHSGDSSDKQPQGAGAAAGGNPQLQLVQRLPSLTGNNPILHKVETWLVQVRCLRGGWQLAQVLPNLQAPPCHAPTPCVPKLSLAATAPGVL
jgi:hypothetical protein